LIFSRGISENCQFETIVRIKRKNLQPIRYIASTKPTINENEFRFKYHQKT
jgi:hypothetical protein